MCFFEKMIDITRVKPLKDSEAQGEVAQLFARLEDEMGSVPKWAEVMGHRAEILTNFTQLLMATMGPGLVEQDNKWKMAYRVSRLNECKYCVSVAVGQLEKLGIPEAEVKEVAIEDNKKLKPDEIVAIKYAEAATKDPNNIPDEIFEELRKYYNDSQIVELTAVIGLFNYTNKFNSALRILP